MIRTTFMSLVTVGMLLGASSALAATPKASEPTACKEHQEFQGLERSISELTRTPKNISADVQSQLIGVFDGGWLIATSLGDHSRAECFAALSDAIGFIPKGRITADEVKLENVKMPAGLAAHVHETAMTVIRRL